MSKVSKNLGRLLSLWLALVMVVGLLPGVRVQARGLGVIEASQVNTQSMFIIETVGSGVEPPPVVNYVSVAQIMSISPLNVNWNTSFPNAFLRQGARLYITAFFRWDGPLDIQSGTVHLQRHDGTGFVDWNHIDGSAYMHVFDANVHTHEVPDDSYDDWWFAVILFTYNDGFDFNEHGGRWRLVYEVDVNGATETVESKEGELFLIDALPEPSDGGRVEWLAQNGGHEKWVFFEGDEIILRAEPTGLDWEFTGWFAHGEALPIATARQHTITVSNDTFANTRLVARFVRLVTINVSVEPERAGTVTLSPAAMVVGLAAVPTSASQRLEVREGTPVVLTANVASPEWEFDGWFVGNSRQSPHLVWEFQAEFDLNVQARFRLRENDGVFRVTKSPGVNSFVYEDEAFTFTATAFLPDNILAHADEVVFQFFRSLDEEDVWVPWQNGLFLVDDVVGNSVTTPTLTLGAGTHAERGGYWSVTAEARNEVGDIIGFAFSYPPMHLEVRERHDPPPQQQIYIRAFPWPPEGGTATISREGASVAGGRNFTVGQRLTITATPNPGWRFVEWRFWHENDINHNAIASHQHTFIVERDMVFAAVFVRALPVINRFVHFTYPRFAPHMTNCITEMTIFEIGVHLSDPSVLHGNTAAITAAAPLAGNTALRPPPQRQPVRPPAGRPFPYGLIACGTFAWYRNGVPWTGLGGSGTLYFCRDGNAEVHLVLPAGLTHMQRGGFWFLRVNLECIDQPIAYSNIGFLQITLPQPPEPEPTPEPPMDVPGPPMPTPTPVPVDPYALFGNLEGIVCPFTAAEAVRQAFLTATPQDLADGLLELFAETAIMYAATRHLPLAGIALSASGLAEQEADASLARLLIGEVFQSVRHVPNRELRLSVAVSTPVYENINIAVDQSLYATQLDFIWVRTPHYSIGLTQDMLRDNANGEVPLSIDATTRLELRVPLAPEMFLAPDPAELRDVPVVTPPPVRVPTGPAPPPLWMPPEQGPTRPVIAPPRTSLVFGSGIGFNPALAIPANGGLQEMRTITVEFNQPVTAPVRLTAEPIDGTPRATQVVRNVETGSIQPVRNNRVTGNLDSRVMESGTYVVVPNAVEFTDVLHLSMEMQSAIRSLASQGILHGFTRLEFRPDQPITRAQAASIFARLLAIEDSNVVSVFDDVVPGDWFHNAVGSVFRAGVMSGHTQTRFGPNEQLPKVQLAVLSARVLRREMRYQLPANPQAVLQEEFNDWATLPDWSRNYVALATRENLVIPRVDGNFLPNSVLSRGEVALMLHRLYLRLW